MTDGYGVAMDSTSATDENATRAGAVKATARRLLVELGAAGLSLEAVAKDSGLAVADVEDAFPHRDDLLTALVIDAYDDSAAAMERADQSAVAAGASAGVRLLAVTRALRDWSFANSPEFTLIYGSPVPGYHAPQDTVPAAARTPAVLAGIVRSALADGELTLPDEWCPDRRCSCPRPWRSSAALRRLRSRT